MGLEKVSLSFLNRVSSNVKDKTKFLARQTHLAENMGFGWKQAAHYDDTIMTLREAFTPFARKTAKLAELPERDHAYYIEEFEKRIGKDYLPKNWSSLSNAEKIDYIVKERYSRLVSNKILNAIKDEKIEHNFGLGADGTILEYNKGNPVSVLLHSAEERREYNFMQKMWEQMGFDIDTTRKATPEIDLHNHPDMSGIIKQVFGIDFKKQNEINPFSGTDLSEYLKDGTLGMVIDGSGHKFIFRPKTEAIGKTKLATSLKELVDKYWQTSQVNIEHLKKFYQAYKDAANNPEICKEEVEKLYNKFLAELEKECSKGSNPQAVRKCLKHPLIEERCGKYEEII